MAEQEFDTEYTQDVTCPWCGKEATDSWEMDDGEYDCRWCDKPFYVNRNVSVDYSTEKVIKEESKNV